MRRLLRRMSARTIAVDALYLSLGACATGAVLAWRVAPLPAAAPEPIVIVGAPAAVATQGAIARETPAIDDIVARGPFRASRARPALRYRIADLAAPTAVPPVRRVVPPVRLQGVLVLPNGRGLAALSLQGRPPQLVRQGEMFEGMRLARVRVDEATLTSRDTTLVLQLPGALHRPR